MRTMELMALFEEKLPNEDSFVDFIAEILKQAPTRFVRAQRTYDMLVLVSDRRLSVRQHAPYGDIMLRRGGGFRV